MINKYYFKNSKKFSFLEIEKDAVRSVFFGAGSRNRTGKMLPSRVFETRASTYSAIPAKIVKKIIKQILNYPFVEVNFLKFYFNFL